MALLKKKFASALAGIWAILCLMVAPSISGAPFVYNTLTASVGTWTGSPFAYSYQWFSECPTCSSYNAIASGGTPDTNSTRTTYYFNTNNLTQTGAKLQAFSGAGWASVTASPTTAGRTAYSNGYSQMISILPTPINYQTDTVNLAANWKSENAHLTTSYFG